MEKTFLNQIATVVLELKKEVSLITNLPQYVNGSLEK